MNIFVKTLSQETSTFQVESCETIYGLKNLICQREGIAPELQTLVYSGACLDNEKTLIESGISSDATLHMSLGLLGGKKGKKKVYSTKKKNKHRHVNVKLAVLKFYNIDDKGKFTRSRKMCPTCGLSIFMAKHFDRWHCGKCGTTFALHPSEIEKKKPAEKKVEAVVEEVTKKGGKAAPKAAAKGGKEAAKGKEGKPAKK